MTLDTSLGALCPVLGEIKLSKSALKRLRRRRRKEARIAREEEAKARGKAWLDAHTKKVEKRRLHTSSKGFIAVIDHQGATLTPYSTIAHNKLKPLNIAIHPTGEYRH